MMNAMQRRRRGVRFYIFVCLIALMMQAPTAAMAQDAKEPEESTEEGWFPSPYPVSSEKRAGQKRGNAFPLRAPLDLSVPVDLKGSDRSVDALPQSWYGWQMLASGGASILFAYFGSVLATPEVGLSLGVAGYVLGGPIIHGVHGSMGKAAASFGINLLSPALLGLIGYGLGGDEGLDAFGGVAIGASVGVLGALLVDSLVLAYEPMTAPEGSSFHIGLSVGLNGLTVVGQF
jgi:hypothetical protein